MVPTESSLKSQGLRVNKGDAAFSVFVVEERVDSNVYSDSVLLA
jgi:hypothetical protein